MIVLRTRKRGIFKARFVANASSKYSAERYTDDIEKAQVFETREDANRARAFDEIVHNTRGNRTMKVRAQEAAFNTYGEGARVRFRKRGVGDYVFTVTSGRGGCAFECQSGDTYNGWRKCLEHCVAAAKAQPWRRSTDRELDRRQHSDRELDGPARKVKPL